ncbi:MAG: hypothetical protein AAGM22_15815 [Acidobacteriota bacterium]
MSKTSSLLTDAFRARRSGQNAEALLLFLSASKEAKKLGDSSAWFKATVWAAESAAYLDKKSQMMSLLLEARAGEPPDRGNKEAALLRMLFFDYWCDYAPSLNRLAEGIEELKLFAESQADVRYEEARILQLRGLYSEALGILEKSWYMSAVSSGYYRYAHARKACYCCLDLSDPAGASSWLRAIRKLGQTSAPGLDVSIGFLELNLALLKGSELPEIQRAYRSLQDAQARIDPDISALYFRVRIPLLDPAGFDPEDPTHPSRQALSARWAKGLSVHSLFSRRRVLIDFRLASLRFALGIDPVDDLYYSKSQVIPALVVPGVALDDVARRLRKARAAAGWAMLYAKKLDDWLECDWRQKEIGDRLNRIDELARAIPGLDEIEGHAGLHADALV